jgi:chitin synthase
LKFDKKLFINNKFFHYQMSQGGYPPSGQRPGQEQPRQTQGYPPTFPTASFSSADPVSQPLLTPSSGGSSSVTFADQDRTKHYGQAPVRQPRRYKTTKRVELFQGNLVLDCPVPSKLLSIVPRQEDREFTHMRYTACTCDPNDFKKNNYTLRQQLYDPPRKTEMFIVLTMYNVSKC